MPPRIARIRPARSHRSRARLGPRCAARFLLALVATIGTPISALRAQSAAPTTATGKAAEPRQASYLSSRLNNKPLPVTDRASDDRGVQYLIEFDELILTILPRHEFRAALRYRQTLASKGSQIGRDPIQKMNVYGTWSAAGSNIRFVPDPKRGGEGLRILDGTFAADRIQVPFDYRNGSVQRRAEVLLLLDAKIF